jgi:hypothetical protein
MKKCIGASLLILGTIGAIFNAYDIYVWTNNWYSWVHTGNMTLEQAGTQGAGIGFGFVVSVYMDIVGYFLLKTRANS